MVVAHDEQSTVKAITKIVVFVSLIIAASSSVMFKVYQEIANRRLGIAAPGPSIATQVGKAQSALSEKKRYPQKHSALRYVSWRNMVDLLEPKLFVEEITRLDADGT